MPAKNSPQGYCSTNMNTKKPFDTVSFIGSVLFAIVAFILVSYFSPSATCTDTAFRRESYQFKIETYRIEQGKNNILEGTNPLGNKEVFKNIGLSNVYDNAAIGDSLIKRNGSTDVIIVRDGRQTVYDCGCRKKDKLGT